MGATDLRLGPRACAVSTLAPPAPGFHSHCIVSFPPVMFAEPEPSPAPIIYSTRSNLSPTVWYLPTIQSDIWKFTISISHLQSWVCIWIVIGKIADIIFMREVHSECNCIVRLSLLSTCSNWTSWEVVSAIKKHKAQMFWFSFANFIKWNFKEKEENPQWITVLFHRYYSATALISTMTKAPYGRAFTGVTVSG